MFLGGTGKSWEGLGFSGRGLLWMMYMLCFFRVGKGDVGGSVEDEDGDGLDEVCDEIAVPEG